MVRTLALRASPSQIDWSQFLKWITAKYSKNYVPTIKTYTRRYCHLLTGNLRDIDLIPNTTRDNTIKSLIVLSKFLGVHKEFKQRLDNYGVKLHRPDAFSSFMRIYSNNGSDISKWYAETERVLKPNERLWLRFLALSGLRKEEAIISFNKIAELRSNLGDYLNSESGILEHFRFKELFLRGTKNVYVSMLPLSLIKEVSSCTSITYEQVRKRLRRQSLTCRFNELRDYFATFMVRHGLIKEEVDLLQGRIPPSIFIRHYWSPSFKELRDRTLEALIQLEQSS